MVRLRIACLVALLFLPQAWAEPKSDDAVATILGARVRLVEGDEARAVISGSDAFTRAMGDYELSLRLGTAEPRTEADYLSHAAASVVAWEPDARAGWSEAARSLAAATKGLNLDLPAEILLVRTQADFDVGMPHTRGNAVILTGPRTEGALQLLAHEVFHLASRHDPALRDRLFPLFGYRKIDPVKLPDAIAPRRLTNPDAFAHRHSIAVTTPDGDAEVVPILSSKVSLEEGLAAEGGIFSILELNLVSADGSGIFTTENTNFVEVAAINTGYIIDPEEVVADNFALLCLRRAGVERELPRPEFLGKLEAALTARAPEPGS